MEASATNTLTRCEGVQLLPQRRLELFDRFERRGPQVQAQLNAAGDGVGRARRESQSARRRERAHTLGRAAAGHDELTGEQ